MFETNETKIRLKLPSEVVVHIPSLSDMSLETCFKAASTHGVKLIQNTISDLIAQEILKRHRKRIEKLVSDKISEIEETVIQKVVSEMMKP